MCVCVCACVCACVCVCVWGNQQRYNILARLLTCNGTYNKNTQVQILEFVLSMNDYGLWGIRLCPVKIKGVHVIIVTIV